MSKQTCTCMLAGDEQSDENKQTQVETRLLKQNVCVLVCVTQPSTTSDSFTSWDWIKKYKGDVFQAVTVFMSFSYENKIRDLKLAQDSW